MTIVTLDNFDKEVMQSQTPVVVGKLVRPVHDARACDGGTRTGSSRREILQGQR